MARKSQYSSMGIPGAIRAFIAKTVVVFEKVRNLYVSKAKTKLYISRAKTKFYASMGKKNFYISLK